MPDLSRRLALLMIVAALCVGGCGSGPEQEASPSSSPTTSTETPSASSASPTPSAEPSSPVSVPSGVSLTDQGTQLSYGDSARVIFESTDSRGTVLRLTVRQVRRAAKGDLTGFALDDAYKKKGSYYYARVRVANVGSGDVGGVAVPLWGVNPAHTFQPCASKPLPARFAPGARLTTCLVFLAPQKGALKAVSYRPSQAFDPITWTGTVQPAASRKPTAPSKKR